ncbi:MAG: PDZ domain-containing protein, partial [Pseudomonadota bacterium]
LVKRIRPAALAGAPLDREAYTRTLWVFEGITSYYDDLALLRAGVLEPTDYLSRLAATVSRVQRGVGRLRQSLSDASFDAWTRFYKQDENAANAIVSYYAKGSLVALALDLSLRQRSDGALSLDAVMRALWQRYQHGEAVAEDGFEALVSELVDEDMGPFFDQAVRGCDDVPLDIYLAAQGVSLKWQPAERSPAWLGCTFRPGTTDVAVVHEDSPAQRGGLTPGDELVAWQGVRFRAEDETALRCSAPVGEAVELDVFRGDELIRLRVHPAAPARSVCVLESKPGFEACRDQWLFGRV